MKRRVRLLGRKAGATLLPLALLGCGRAPSLNIVGSFFPAWLLCILAGLVITGIARWVFGRLHLHEAIAPTILIYPCLALASAFTLWLLLFR